MTQVTMNNLDNVAGGALALNNLSALALADNRLLSLVLASISNTGMFELTPEQLQELIEEVNKTKDPSPRSQVLSTDR